VSGRAHVGDPHELFGQFRSAWITHDAPPGKLRTTSFAQRNAPPPRRRAERLRPMQPNDLPIVCLPMDISDEAAAKLLGFLYQITEALERRYAGQLIRYAHRYEPEAPPIRMTTPPTAHSEPKAHHFAPAPATSTPACPSTKSAPHHQNHAGLCQG
jgi:hypothetical protein